MHDGTVGRLYHQIHFTQRVRAAAQGDIVGQDARVRRQGQQGVPEALVVAAETSVRRVAEQLGQAVRGCIQQTQLMPELIRILTPDGVLQRIAHGQKLTVKQRRAGGYPGQVADKRVVKTRWHRGSRICQSQLAAE